MVSEHFSWWQQGLDFIVFGIVVYAVWSLASPLWRVPGLILAKKELAEAQTRYYKALADKQESLNEE